jgi:hypothetical protein
MAAERAPRTVRWSRSFAPKALKLPLVARAQPRGSDFRSDSQHEHDPATGIPSFNLTLGCALGFEITAAIGDHLVKPVIDLLGLKGLPGYQQE